MELGCVLYGRLASTFARGSPSLPRHAHLRDDNACSLDGSSVCFLIEEASFVRSPLFQYCP